MQPSLIAIFGPTGVGKTALALALADRLRAQSREPVAVSADALQVYRGLEILTGVATPAEQRRLEHRLVSFLPVSESFSAGQFATLAHAEIDALLDAGKTPLVVGGTGLYLRAALATLDLKPAPPPEVRARWSERLATAGAPALHARLTAAAPWAAATIDANDGHRIVRALELHELGALKPSDGPNRLWTGETRHPTRLIGLVREREDLNARIDVRVEQMLADGVRDEVLAADKAGASQTARKALGFADLLKDDAEAMKLHTRRYAKRQLTWLRKLPDVELVDLTGREPADVAAELLA
jgi:tRNA dimethylallyltransferase